MKRSSHLVNPLFSSHSQWTLASVRVPHPLARIDPWNTALPATQAPLDSALRDAPPLVWGDHHPGMGDQPVRGSQPVCLPPTETLPPLFQPVGDLSHIGQRAEQVLLDAASDPPHFLDTLKGLLGPARQLAEHRQIDPTQGACLERLPITALAIAHQQGLTQDAEYLKGLGALALEHREGLSLGEQWRLLSDLEAALQDHADTHDTGLSPLPGQRQALEQDPFVADFLPRDPRTLGGASLEEKEACLKALVNQHPPCGPFFVAQWAWAARHWTEPELRPYLLDGVKQLLTEAAKGVQGNHPFRGTFLFERFPERLLIDAFYRVGGPDNAKLLQVPALTDRSRSLLNHYLQNTDIPEADRQRLRHWHSID